MKISISMVISLLLIYKDTWGYHKYTVMSDLMISKTHFCGISQYKLNKFSKS